MEIYIEENWDYEMYNDPGLFFAWGYGLYMNRTVHLNFINYGNERRRD